MTIIGLTGGIAAGKSTAAEMLREVGAVVIDADRLGHRSYEPGTPGFQKVVNAFGHDIVAKDGTIDRRVLGGKVFGAPGQLERLNAIVWPEIRALIKDEVEQIRSQDAGAIIVLEAAVLLEAKWQDLCDEVWVVVTPVKVAVDRLKERNNLAEDAAMARINAQMSNKERSAEADVKIENASTEDELRARVERAWKAFLTRHRPKAKGEKATKTGSVKAAAKPAPRAAVKASAPKASGSKATAPKAAGKPATKATEAKATAKPASKASKPAAKAASKVTAKPAAKAPAKSTTTRAASAKAAPKTAPKATAKTTTKAAPKATSKAAAAKRPTARTTKPAAKAPGTRSK
ncbi:MAG: dephospho-CoA kinase [Chloroflexi bacterium]|nr:dephospho-CoA kinase [Chloroflexota bacterium]